MYVFVSLRRNISLGTSGTAFISQDSFSVDSNNALHSFAHSDGKYHLMRCILSAASCNKWWLENIIGTKDYAEILATVGCGEYKNIYEAVNKVVKFNKIFEPDKENCKEI